MVRKGRRRRTARRSAGLQATSAGQERPLVQKNLPQPPEAPDDDCALRRRRPAARARASGDKVLVNLENERLPVFIQIVFGNILKRSFTIAPQVAARTDLVTVRAAAPQTAEQVEDLARKVLQSYGVAPLDLGGGVLRFVPNDAQTGMLPEIQRGRAMPETPLADAAGVPSRRNERGPQHRRLPVAEEHLRHPTDDGCSTIRTATRC